MTARPRWRQLGCGLIGRRTSGGTITQFEVPFDELNGYGGATLPSGAFILQLLLDPTWIRRRVESIDFIGDETVRRRVSVTFDLRSYDRLDELRSQSKEDLTDIYVPIAFLRKGWALADFDFRDNTGNALALPNRGASSLLAAEALMCLGYLFLLQHYIGIPSLEDYEARRRALDEIAECKKDIYNIVTLAPTESTRILDAWKKLSDSPHGGRDPRRKLLDEPQFSRLLEELSGSFILLAPITGSRLESPQLIKFSYLSPLKWAGGLRNAGQRLGWVDTSVRFTAPAAGFGASYHIEVQSPDTVHINSARLIRQTVSERGTIKSDTVAAIDGRAYSAHLSTHSPNRWDNYYMRLGLRPQPRGLVRSALLAALLCAGTLWALYFRLGPHGDGHRLDIPTTGALLVGVPVVLAAIMLRPDEHEVVSRMYFLVRAAVLTSILCSLVAIGLIALAFDGRVLMDSLFWLSIASTIVFAAIGVTYLRNSRRPERTLTVHGVNLGPLED